MNCSLFHLGTFELLAAKIPVLLSHFYASYRVQKSAFWTLYCLYNALEVLYSLLRYLILLVMMSTFKYSRHLITLVKHLASRVVKHHFKA